MGQQFKRRFLFQGQLEPSLFNDLSEDRGSYLRVVSVKDLSEFLWEKVLGCLWVTFLRIVVVITFIDVKIVASAVLIVFRAFVRFKSEFWLSSHSFLSLNISTHFNLVHIWRQTDCHHRGCGALLSAAHWRWPLQDLLGLRLRRALLSS